MKLLVGLGNPGAKYARHRHNAGFMAVDEIALCHDFGPWKARFQGAAAEGRLAGEKCLLLKPMTYMNESGRSAGEAVRFYKIPLEDVVVIHDEIDLAPGKMRVKAGGGVAGHNGLKSLAAYIGNDYRRVRIGVGHPGAKDMVHRHVLHDFSRDEHDWLDPLLDAIARAAPRLATGDDANFMNDVARLTAPPKPEKKKAPEPEPVAKSAAPGREKPEGPMAAMLRKLTGGKDKQG